MRIRFVAVTSAAMALLGAILLLNRERVLLAVGEILVIQDELVPADVIHVISGPDHRTDYGIALYKQGYGKQLFFTGGWCPDIQGVHAERGEERALAQGILPQAIAIDGSEVQSTYSEALRLKAYLDQSPVPVHSVIIVSDPHHMRRARWAYRRVLGDAISLQMAPVPYELSPYERDWWTAPKSTRMVRDEYLKLAYYIARYQFSWGPLTEWLASLDRD